MLVVTGKQAGSCQGAVYCIASSEHVTWRDFGRNVTRATCRYKVCNNWSVSV